MPSSEQYRLSQNIPKIFAAATRQGSLFDLEYWGPTQLLINLAVTPFVLLSACLRPSVIADYIMTDYLMIDSFVNDLSSVFLRLRPRQFQNPPSR